MARSWKHSFVCRTLEFDRSFDALPIEGGFYDAGCPNIYLQRNDYLGAVFQEDAEPFDRADSSDCHASCGAGRAPVAVAAHRNVRR